MHYCNYKPIKEVHNDKGMYMGEEFTCEECGDTYLDTSQKVTGAKISFAFGENKKQ